MQTNIADDSFVTIYGWMRTRLGLKTNTLFIFALIYGYNNHTGHEFYGSIKYMQDWLGIGSDNTIRVALKQLCEEKQYLLKRYEKTETGLRIYYRVNPAILPPKDGSINPLWQIEADEGKAPLPKVAEIAQEVILPTASSFAKNIKATPQNSDSQKNSIPQKLSSPTSEIEVPPTQNLRTPTSKIEVPPTQNLQEGTSKTAYDNNKDKDKEKEKIQNNRKATIDFSQLLEAYDASTNGQFMKNLFTRQSSPEAFQQAAQFMKHTSGLSYLQQIKETKLQVTDVNGLTYNSINSFYSKYRYLEMLPATSNIRKGFYIYGNPGTGKTFILAALYNGFLTIGVPAIFVSAPEAIQILLDYVHDPNCSELDTNPLELFKEVDVLILDDIDKITPTPWALTQLYDIINTRYTNYRCTFFTSNHTLKELTRELSKRNPKDTITAASITDRMAGMCYPLSLEGNSWRQQL